MIYGIFVWTLAIFFYFYEFFLRVLPATLATEIMKDLHLSAEEFAWMSASYYITYSLMQTPVGVIYDRFGVRIFLPIACTFCTLGLLGFALSSNFLESAFCRLLIGFGSSFGFISLLTLALNWFPHKYFGFLAGVGQMLGAVGPLAAGAPVAFLMAKYKGDWSLIFLHIAFLGAILTLLLALFIRNRPPTSNQEVFFLEKPAPLWERIREVLRVKQVWITMLYSGTIYLSLPLLGAYWGTLYLEVRGFDKTSAAWMVSMMWIGLAIGSPLFGRLSDHFKRRRPSLMISALLGVCISLLVLYLPLQTKTPLSFLFLALGIAGGGQSLSFAVVVDHVPESLKGTALGVNNTAIMLCAALIPPLITWFMEEGGTGTSTYTVANFQEGLLAMPIAFSIAFLVSWLWMKETFCRNENTIYYL